VDQFDRQNLALNPCCFRMYVNCYQTVFEVVKEGRILYKIKHLQIQIVSVFYFTPGLRQVLDENGVFLTEKMS
jgi:hypothetical protein